MSRSRSDILVITTGGTIDAEPYDKTPESVTVRKDSLVPQALETLGISEGVYFFHWLQKDSKSISTDDLKYMANIIKSDERKLFIITHGTDAMPENSRKLYALLQNSSKRVVLTGSMVPLSHGMEHSDGYENLKVAVETLKKPISIFGNVAVVMGGKVWRTERLAKDFDKKEFFYEEKSFSERFHPSERHCLMSKL